MTWTWWWASDNPTYGHLQLAPAGVWPGEILCPWWDLNDQYFPFVTIYSLKMPNISLARDLTKDTIMGQNKYLYLGLSQSKYRIDSLADMFDGSMLTSINKTAPWSPECQQKWHPTTYSLASESDITLKVLALIYVVKWRQSLIRLATENIFYLQPPGNCANEIEFRNFVSSEILAVVLPTPLGTVMSV